MDIVEHFMKWKAQPFKFTKPKGLVKLFANLVGIEKGGKYQEAYLGEAPGNTLQEVCDNLAKADTQFRFYYNAKELTYWGANIYTK